jgi:hypothetical protein
MAKDTMLNDWYEHDNDVASGSSCPISDCGALAVAYGSPSASRDKSGLCEFTCPRCGSDFIASSDALIFQSVPKKRNGCWRVFKSRRVAMVEPTTHRILLPALLM